jgi:hypothetical protein
LGSGLPPRGVPLLIKEVNGRILAGEIASIYEEDTMIKLEKVSVLEVVGMKHGLEPIYDYRAKSIRFAFVRVKEIAHWENLPKYLKLQD